jgi:hypothetical protein
MNTAVQSGLVGSFLERNADATGVGLRLRIYAIALVLFLDGLLSIESMFVRPALIDIIGIFEVLAAVGLVLRNRTGLRLAVFLTMLAGIGAAAAVTGVPNTFLLNWAAASRPGPDLVSAIAIVEIVAFAALAYLMFRSWWRIEKAVRAFGPRLALPFRVVAMIGAVEAVLTSALQIFGVLVFSFGAVVVAHPALSPLIVILICVAALPEFVFVFWSYGVLRGNATREYFSSSR